MTNKLTSLGLVLISSFLLAGCTKQTATTTQTPTQAKPEAEIEAKEFTQAVESGNSTLCTITKGTDYMSMEYLLKGKMYKITSHYTPPANEGSSSTTSYSVSDSLYFYSWSDQSSQGTKIKIPTPEEAEAMAANNESPPNIPQLSSESDFDDIRSQGFTVICNPAEIQDSEFLLPDNIIFVDPSEITGQ